MPRVGFEPKIPVFERAKTVHPLDLAATVIDYFRDILAVNTRVRCLLSLSRW
jgi:hypothetical protein